MVVCPSCKGQQTDLEVSDIRNNCCAILKIPDTANSNVSKHLIDFVKLNHIGDDELSYLYERNNMKILELTEKATCEEAKIASSRLSNKVPNSRANDFGEL